jgi:serine/threonine protein kinase
VHDVGEAQVEGRDVPFLVLELLDGETLAARLRRERVPIEQALAFAIDIADALALAHGQGVVHRDVKPSNVMVTRSGIKLLDFGLAQLRTPASAGDASAMTRDSSLTSVGMVVGTLPYLAPEQLDGRKADARSDIFSFGAVLYEMLTGQRAFPGDSGRSAAAQILSDDPRPLHELEPSVSAELARIVSHCLRKDPERRYHDIADVKVALEDVRDELLVPARPATARAWPRSRLAWIMLLPAAAILLLYMAWGPRIAPETLPPPHLVPLTTLPGAEFSPTLSPDGQSVAFVWSGVNRDNGDIYVQRIGSGPEVRRTTHPAHDFSPSWSPDGQWIAFLRGEVPGRSELMLVSPFGGPEQSRGEIDIRYAFAYPPHLAWLPDSQALIVVHSPPDKPTGLSVFSIPSREMQALTSPPVSPGIDRAPAVSPDGRTVAFKRGPDIFVAGIAADRRAVISPRPLVHWPFATAMTWTPDGKEIVFASERSLWRVDASGARPPALVPFVGQDAYMPVLSRPGGGSSMRLVYVQMTSDANIWRLDLAAAGAAPSATPALFSPSTRLDANPQLSPDGKRVAFQSLRSGVREIWIADSDGAIPCRSRRGAKARGGPPAGRRMDNPLRSMRIWTASGTFS